MFCHHKKVTPWNKYCGNSGGRRKEDGSVSLSNGGGCPWLGHRWGEGTWLPACPALKLLLPRESISSPTSWTKPFFFFFFFLVSRDGNAKQSLKYKLTCQCSWGGSHGRHGQGIWWRLPVWDLRIRVKTKAVPARSGVSHTTTGPALEAGSETSVKRRPLKES